MSINTALGVRDTPAVTVRTRSGKDGNGPEAKENDFDPDLDGIEDEVQARFSAEQEEIIATAKASIDECIGKGKVVKRFSEKTIEYMVPDALMDDSMAGDSFAAMDVIRWVPEVTHPNLCGRMKCPYGCGSDHVIMNGWCPDTWVVVSIPRTKLMVTKQYYCKACKKHFRGWNPRAVATLPPEIRGRFPVYITHRVAIERWVVDMAVRQVPNGQAINDVQKMAKELNYLHCEQEHLIYGQASVAERLRAQNEAHVPLKHAAAVRKQCSSMGIRSKPSLHFPRGGMDTYQDHRSSMMHPLSMLKTGLTGLHAAHSYYGVTVSPVMPLISSPKVCSPTVMVHTHLRAFAQYRVISATLRHTVGSALGIILLMQITCLKAYHAARRSIHFVMLRSGNLTIAVKGGGTMSWAISQNLGRIVCVQRVTLAVPSFSLWCLIKAESQWCTLLMDALRLWLPSVK